MRTRELHGRELSCVEGWYVISAANRIFGFEGWSRETLEAKCVFARENRGAFLAVYTAKVRITVAADGDQIVREGHGTGEGRGNSPGEAHDTALKAAETDATKRALITFGKPFGLELYRSDQPRLAKAAPHREQPAYVPPEQVPSPSDPNAPGLQDAKPHPDDATPIPRPSTHYGLERYLESREGRGALVKQAAREAFVAEQRHNSGQSGSKTAEPAAAPHPRWTDQGKIDKSALPLPEPKRLRDKNHLKFVASQPCIVCGRQPSDPHHLRFAQPRAIGLKISHEFTVPLCRGHHRNLHQAGNELRWWENFRIEPLPIARRLWEETHPETTRAPGRNESGVGQIDQAEPNPAGAG